MLTRRTNVLLTEDDYTMLSVLSDRKKVTRGELIRQAIKKYCSGYRKKSRSDALGVIDKLASRVNTKGIDYKKLVEFGRKY